MLLELIYMQFQSSLITQTLYGEIHEKWSEDDIVYNLESIQFWIYHF